jgi:ATP-dependent Clp protease ATP-binding subunit ClpC
MISLVTVASLAALVIGFVVGRRYRPFIRPVALLPGPRKKASPYYPADNDCSLETQSLYQLAERLDSTFKSIAHPRDLLGSSDFKQAVELLETECYSNDDLLGHYAEGPALIACIALEALCYRLASQHLVDEVLDHISSRDRRVLFFALRLLNNKSGGPVAGRLLLAAGPWWANDAMILQMLNEFIDERVVQGERLGFGETLKTCPRHQVDTAENLLRSLKNPRLRSLRRELATYERIVLDVGFLNSIGRLWPESIKGRSLWIHAGFKSALTRTISALTAPSPRSLMIVGEPGVGKSALVGKLAALLAKRRIRLFEAGIDDLLRDRPDNAALARCLAQLATHIDRRRRILWYLPHPEVLLDDTNGSVAASQIVEGLLPLVETGTLLVVAEVRRAGYQRLAERFPELTAAFDTVVLFPPENPVLAALARSRIKASIPEGTITTKALMVAMQLAGRYLTTRSAPGNLLALFAVVLRQRRKSGVTGVLTLNEVYSAMHRMTGLPLTILDHRRRLDDGQLRARLNRRLVGQTEAVQCLVERIALIKAGLKDPSRLMGVLLLVGPVGTGKSTFCTALTEILYGSSRRLIRLPMDEYTDADGEDRFWGGNGSEPGLMEQVRRQPFCVIQLEGLHKARQNVQTLIRRLFTRGHAMDGRGERVEFRHTVVVVTMALEGSQSLGVSADLTRTDAAAAARERLGAELMDCFDRVVDFRPFSKAAMRRIMRYKLDEILVRRGMQPLGRRVEWEDGAFELLQGQGFSSGQGARPLQGAMVRQLLPPLATVVAAHPHLRGEQFFLVRAVESKMVVEFIDPAEPGEMASIPLDTGRLSDGSAGQNPLGRIILAPGREVEQVEQLMMACQRLTTAVTAKGWRDRRRKLGHTIARAASESDPERRVAMAALAVMDRIESGLQTVEALLGRLMRIDSNPLGGYCCKIMVRLAQQLYLLQRAQQGLEAGAANDAMIVIQPETRTPGAMKTSTEFAIQLGMMYQQWAHRRGMRATPIPVSSQVRLMAVSGLGAYAVLVSESGLHVMETTETGGGELISVRVTVAGWTRNPGGEGDDVAQDVRELLAVTKPAAPFIVRRYRPQPEPLVEDQVRGYTTRHLEAVLAGDFDLFG